VAKATFTDFANVVVWKTHCDISIPPLGWVLALVSLTASPWTASISALLRSVQTSIFSFAEAEALPTLALCSELSCVWPVASGAADKRKLQDNIRMV
jgi:hypothetical protein